MSTSVTPTAEMKTLAHRWPTDLTQLWDRMQSRRGLERFSDAIKLVDALLAVLVQQSFACYRVHRLAGQTSEPAERALSERRRTPSLGYKTELLTALVTAEGCLLTETGAFDLNKRERPGMAWFAERWDKAYSMLNRRQFPTPSAMTLHDWQAIKDIVAPRRRALRLGTFLTALASFRNKHSHEGDLEELGFPADFNEAYRTTMLEALDAAMLEWARELDPYFRRYQQATVQQLTLVDGGRRSASVVAEEGTTGRLVEDAEASDAAERDTVWILDAEQRRLVARIDVPMEPSAPEATAGRATSSAHATRRRTLVAAMVVAAAMGIAWWLLARPQPLSPTTSTSRPQPTPLPMAAPTPPRALPVPPEPSATVTEPPNPGEPRSPASTPTEPAPVDEAASTGTKATDATTAPRRLSPRMLPTRPLQRTRPKDVAQQPR